MLALKPRGRRTARELEASAALHVGELAERAACLVPDEVVDQVLGGRGPVHGAPSFNVDTRSRLVHSPLLPTWEKRSSARADTIPKASSASGSQFRLAEKGESNTGTERPERQRERRRMTRRGIDGRGSEEGREGERRVLEAVGGDQEDAAEPERVCRALRTLPPKPRPSRGSEITKASGWAVGQTFSVMTGVGEGGERATEGGTTAKEAVEEREEAGKRVMMSSKSRSKSCEGAGRGGARRSKLQRVPSRVSRSMAGLQPEVPVEKVCMIRKERAKERARLCTAGDG